jgi:hypothetical protein
MLPVMGFRDETTADIVVSCSGICSTDIDAHARFELTPLRTDTSSGLFNTVCDISDSIKPILCTVTATTFHRKPLSGNDHRLKSGVSPRFDQGKTPIGCFS